MYGMSATKSDHYLVTVADWLLFGWVSVHRSIHPWSAIVDQCAPDGVWSLDSRPPSYLGPVPADAEALARKTILRLRTAVQGMEPAVIDPDGGDVVAVLDQNGTVWWHDGLAVKLASSGAHLDWRIDTNGVLVACDAAGECRIVCHPLAAPSEVARHG